MNEITTIGEPRSTPGCVDQCNHDEDRLILHALHHFFEPVAGVGGQ